MMRKSELFPEPFAPITPIFAPGRKARVMFSRTFLSGGWTFVTSCIVKTNSGMAGPLYQVLRDPAVASPFDASRGYLDEDAPFERPTTTRFCEPSRTTLRVR